MAQPLEKFNNKTFKTISPIDGSIYLERMLNNIMDIDRALDNASMAQKKWQGTPLSERQELLTKAVKYLVSKSDEIAKEITWQMGRPISQSAGELRGLEERALHMIDIAPRALADIVPDEKLDFERRIKRVPLGIVAIIAPWNYPYLTSVNGIIPALLSGNAVILKHSHQTPLVADRYAEAFKYAGLPDGLFQTLDLSHEDTEIFVSDPRVDFVNFTGSVKGGHAIQKAISDKFISSGLELGGKDPAYVREDANLQNALENLVDGSFFNSGQSCCGIERIYVHENIYDEFVSNFVELTSKYRLGNPLEQKTNLGPMVKPEAADFVRSEIQKAITKGAKALIDESNFPASKPGTPYLAPQILVDVDHSMSIMTEESFGPVVGIMKVTSDAEAINLMNDSIYGLTASIWTSDINEADKIAQKIETGTVFVNRCDYLDPALAWTGVKNSGRGCTLSSIGFEHLTRPKSFHYKKV
jgi:acyl-CoA reductase-like NAD-dependent aldehyde dehydrogenase